MLITVDDVLEHSPGLISAKPDVIGRFIDRADELQAIYCGWPETDLRRRTMQLATYSLFLEGRCAEPRVLRIPHPAARVISSLHIDRGWSSFATAYGPSTEVLAADYRLDLRTRELFVGNRYAFLGDPRANRVIFTAGFIPSDPSADPPVVGDVPPALVALTATTVRHLIDQRRVQGVSSVSGMGESSTRTDTDSLLPLAVRNGLTPWIEWSSRLG